MYGSSANLVISTGQGVNGYTLDNVSLLSDTSQYGTIARADSVTIPL